MIKKKRQVGSGALTEQVGVVTVTETPDGYGGFTTAEATQNTWAMVMLAPSSAGEQAEADQQRDVQRYKITVRNSGVGATITTNNKLTWRGLTLNIKSARVVDRTNGYREFIALANAGDW